MANISDILQKEDSGQMSMMENITNLAQELLENVNLHLITFYFVVFFQERQEPTFSTTPKLLKTASFYINGNETADENRLNDFNVELIANLVEKNIKDGTFTPDPLITRFKNKVF